MERDGNFNPVYPSYPDPTSCSDVPDDAVMTAYSYVKSLSSARPPPPSQLPPMASRRPSLRTQVRNHIGSINSGSSTVAIDNKIEQAMDLVKSHLMYAVREEVEVLKEQIKELMERMRTVEYENKVLRSEASQETLAKLPAPLPPLQNPLLQQFMTAQPPSSSS